MDIDELMLNDPELLLEASRILKREITQLKADLAKYGGHRWDCPAHPDEHGFLNNEECDCGYAEAQERWK